MEPNMIRHFEKIKNLGVFADYKKSKNTAPFKQFNLIYGMNGSGKTTLSRFFADLVFGEAKGFPDLEYKVITSDGTEYTEGKPFIGKIKVFNLDYVDANIGEIGKAGKNEGDENNIKPIFVIGAENKKLAEVVEKDEDDLTKLKRIENEKNDELEKISLKRDNIFTDVAREISTHSSGTVARNYRRNNAAKAFKNLENPHKLNVDELAVAVNATKQARLDKHNHVSFGNISLKIKENQDIEFFEALDFYEDTIITIAEENAESKTIQRLLENPDIAEWVEHGMEIHEKHNGKNCEYCQQIIPTDRIKELAEHFNASDSILKDKIEKMILGIEHLHKQTKIVTFPDSNSFYEELKEKYSTKLSLAHDLFNKLDQHLNNLNSILKNKLNKRSESYTVQIKKYESRVYKSVIGDINIIIDEHNNETDKFDSRHSKYHLMIEKHFLSDIYDQVKEKDNEIKEINNILKRCKEGEPTSGKLGIDTLQERIKKNKLQISSAHKAAEELSQKLASFLGHSNLRFESKGDGYSIMRSGRIAKRLSEGEKTAITFLHFVVSLKDRDFDVAKGIVVIDDPISSLDSNSIYQAFSYLKNAVVNAEQVFILTHNFEFLKILLYWLQNSPNTKKNTTYLMLHCSNENDTQRETTFEELDETLCKYKDEFTYLFKLLKAFSDDNDGTLAKAYPYPNMIRKVWETFLEQHSMGGSLYEKMENLKFPDKNKKTAVNKYSNDLSHPTFSGLDPAVINETQTNIKHLIEIIESVAPRYYESLMYKINQTK